jgi:hypothetical protein
MSWFKCRHKWDIRAQVISEPIVPPTHCSIEPAMMVQLIDAIKGSMSVVMTCGKCGKIAVQTLPGVTAEVFK